MDQTYAIALQIAEKKLTSMGWKFTFSDIGEEAAVIVNALIKNIDRKNEEEPK